MKKKILIILVIIVILIAVCFIIFKKDNNSSTKNNYLYDEYINKINELLNYDNKIKKIFYSKVDVDSEDNIISNNNTYYLLKDSFGFNSIDEIYNKISNIYSINYKKKFLNDINNYNSLLMLKNSFYINIKYKCYISNFNEEIDIVNINEDENTIEYKYGNNVYKVLFNKDESIYLIETSPFDCM